MMVLLLTFIVIRFDLWVSTTDRMGATAVSHRIQNLALHIGHKKQQNSDISIGQSVRRLEHSERDWVTDSAHIMERTVCSFDVLKQIHQMFEVVKPSCYLARLRCSQSSPE